MTKDLNYYRRRTLISRNSQLDIHGYSDKKEYLTKETWLAKKTNGISEWCSC